MKVRVLAVGNAYPPHTLGGYEIVWSDVSRALRAQGHVTRVLTTTYRAPGVPADAAQQDDVHRELRWYWRDHAWPEMSPRERLSLERHNASVFDRHRLEFAPNVVAWWPMGGMSLSLIERARRAGLPAVLFVHDYWPTYGRQRDLWIRMWARRPRSGALAERLTAVPARPRLEEAGRWLFNARCVQEETRRAGLSPPNSAVLSPGVGAEFLAAGAGGPEPEWRWRLLYLGRVVAQKGVHLAVEALPSLPEARLLVVGEGDVPYRRQLEDLAGRLGVDRQVEFAPPRQGSELLATYAAADAVLFPVVWEEPWGLVPLEAMALGRPVVGTGRGGSGDYLRDGTNSLLFAPEDPRGLAAAVRRLAADPALRARLRRGGRHTAERHSAASFNECAVQELVRAAGRG